ncbi:MAG TPA: AtpZ/AtpI family protein [Armatimonadota bacterium]|nr:AtpZ/AtpI family protein [Armatimonadota bacterium]HPP74757.1 AtpZ/AtpI family protein [Armatimonadota bacterium]
MANRDYNWMRKAGLASSIGIMMVVSVVIGWLFGSWLDSKLGTAPWMMLIFTLMGIAAGFIEMIRIAIVLSKED